MKSIGLFTDICLIVCLNILGKLNFHEFFFVPLRGEGIIEQCCLKRLIDELNSLPLLILIM